MLKEKVFNMFTRRQIMPGSLLAIQFYFLIDSKTY